MEKLKFKNIDVNDIWEEYRETLPEESGIYIFYLKNCCIYIGRSKNLKQRISTHLHTDKYSIIHTIFRYSKNDTFKVKFALVRKNLILKTERYCINKMKPVFNTAHNCPTSRIA